MDHSFLAAQGSALQAAVQNTLSGFVYLDAGVRQTPVDAPARDCVAGSVMAEEQPGEGADFSSRRLIERRTVRVFVRREDGAAVDPLTIRRGAAALVAGESLPWTIERVSGLGTAQVTCELSRAHQVDHQRGELTRRLRD